ncbi:transmembrane protein 26 [Neocloeon triangulifer]|uniref:transmembrane protein 26 n=1 Tax=Neocloeon triangulifer TaxID=2078957 RepID=UPI00286F3862|nr:transmembrane protein 26 [Neocloeon triangulifer]
MAKVVASIKAIVTRVVFGSHGLLAIWQVTILKKDLHFWYLSAPILLLFFEGIFTLTIKRSQEWKWFCPSVFLYLASVVPAIWLLELDKLDKRYFNKGGDLNATTPEGLQKLDQLLGISALNISPDTWLTLIEQFLMLILILGRWMLPKGDLTRDQLSQLLLVYIGTAADIIEFFDTFQDETIGKHPVLPALTLAIWSWSLLQFTVVLTATKSSRRSRISAPAQTSNRRKGKKKRGRKGAAAYCCSVDVWAIVINILLQDAPFVIFRGLLIGYYRIISYMNIFFTCKNTLVIALQLYRLYVVFAEKRNKLKKQQKLAKGKKNNKRDPSPDISFVLANAAKYGLDFETAAPKSKKKGQKQRNANYGLASCSELLGVASNPASRLDTGGQRLNRRKSVSANDLHELELGEEEEYLSEDEQETARVGKEEQSSEEEDAPEEQGDSFSEEDDPLAEFTPAQISSILSAAANSKRSRATVAPARGLRQDTGYSTATSSSRSRVSAKKNPKTRISSAHSTPGRSNRVVKKSSGGRRNASNTMDEQI